MRQIKKLPFFILFFIFGCAAKTTYNIHISLIGNYKVKISGLDDAIMQDIGRTPGNNWENLFAFYAMPADTAMKDYQPALHGAYRVTGDAVLFTPDTPFTKHKNYFLRHYLYSDDKSIFNYLKNKGKSGKVDYIDLIFKP